MSVSASDIKIYGTANIAEADGSTHGGTINTQVRYVFDDSTLANTLNEAVRAFSSDAVDTTQTVTVTGRLSTGVIDTDPLTLIGTGYAVGTKSFERLLKIVCNSGHNGSITVEATSDGDNIAVLESGVLQVRRPFYNVAADISGGSSRDFYEKIFVKNTNTTSALLGARIIESADPTGKVTFALATAQNDAETIASRINTAPSAVGSFNSSDKAIANTDLLPGSGQAVWIKLTLAAGDAATKSTYTLSASGTTT